MNYKEEIKAVAFDFDGTLIDFKYNATELTKTALKKLCDSDQKVFLLLQKERKFVEKSWLILFILMKYLKIFKLI